MRQQVELVETQQADEEERDEESDGEEWMKKDGPQDQQGKRNVLQSKKLVS